uniref:3-dehydrosphinganine reductase n=1 Tax=Phallusia mammillata TaxID=59560 RepID=A0A6F9DGD5_9ASCI|nr:3-ketodihydrosphingosine reductase-like [Phallusia mammillata]
MPNLVSQIHNSKMLILILFPVVIIVLLFIVSSRPSRLNVAGSHILITGGSSGIGLEIAKEFARKGGFITLVARNEQKLLEAKSIVEQHMKGGGERQCVTILPLDVASSAKEVLDGIKSTEERLGPVDYLINCAGISFAGTFEDTPTEQFELLMKVNYFGSIYCTKAVLPGMKKRKKGRIVFVSSQAGQTGVFGYTAYCPTKFALRGFAETLQMEVKPYNIAVTVSFPPDTDTPGFHDDDDRKPEETQLISETSGFFMPDAVGKAIFRDAVRGEFSSTIGLDGFILGQVTAGMSPCNSMLTAFCQIALMGPFRMVSLAYLKYFDGIVSKCARKRECAVQEEDKDKEASDAS